MNTHINDYRQRIHFLGIAIFVATIYIPISIGLYYLFKTEKYCYLSSVFSSGGDSNCISVCCICLFSFIMSLLWCFFRYSCEICFSREMNQTKLSCILFLIFLPVLFGAILSFISSYLNKIIYNDYLSMELINDYKNENILENIMINMDISMIFAISIVVFFILYIILICIANSLKNSNDRIKSTKTPLILPDDEDYLY